MTPTDYIKQLKQFIGAGRDEDALEFAARFETDVTPPLSAEQFDLVCGMMEGAELAVSIDRAARRRLAEPAMLSTGQPPVTS
jgi:hypothetical protein